MIFNKNFIFNFYFSPALGQGWRLGFLGLLHLEVFCQRLQQEYGADPILTAPSVTYKVKLKKTKAIEKSGVDEILINNPVHFPEQQKIEESYEPFVKSAYTYNLYKIYCVFTLLLSYEIV